MRYVLGTWFVKYVFCGICWELFLIRRLRYVLGTKVPCKKSAVIDISQMSKNKVEGDEMGMKFIPEWNKVIVISISKRNGKDSKVSTSSGSPSSSESPSRSATPTTNIRMDYRGTGTLSGKGRTSTWPPFGRSQGLQAWRSLQYALPSPRLHDATRQAACVRDPCRPWRPGRPLREVWSLHGGGTERAAKRCESYRRVAEPISPTCPQGQRSSKVNYGAVRSSKVNCGAVRSSTVWRSGQQSSKVNCGAVRSSTVWRSGQESWTVCWRSGHQSWTVVWRSGQRSRTIWRSGQRSWTVWRSGQRSSTVNYKLVKKETISFVIFLQNVNKSWLIIEGLYLYRIRSILVCRIRSIIILEKSDSFYLGDSEYVSKRGPQKMVKFNKSMFRARNFII